MKKCYNKTVRELGRVSHRRTSTLLTRQRRNDYVICAFSLESFTGEYRNNEPVMHRGWRKYTCQSRKGPNSFSRQLLEANLVTLSLNETLNNDAIGLLCYCSVTTNSDMAHFHNNARNFWLWCSAA